MQNANSVHLQRIPNFERIPFNADVMDKMSFVAKVCNAALSIRKKNNIKARIPLSSILIAGVSNIIDGMFVDVIKDEANVKFVNFADDLSHFQVKKTANLDAQRIAKRLGKEFQAVLQSAKSGEFVQLGRDIEINGHRIAEGEYEIQLSLEGSDTNYASIDGRYLIILDTNVTDELKNEGIARDFIRAVQNARKEADLELTDHIAIDIFSRSSEINQALEANMDYIKSQVLGKEIEFRNTAEKSENCTAFIEDIYFRIRK